MMHKYLESQSRDLLQQQKKQENLIFLAAHNLKAPLRFIRHTVENFENGNSRNGSLEEKALDTSDLLRQIGTMNDTIDDLIMYARPQHVYSPDVPIELGPLLEDIQKKMADTKEVFIVLEDEPAPFKSSKAELELVLSNLINQSLSQHVQANTITVSAKIKDNITTFNIINTSVAKSKKKTKKRDNEDMLYPLPTSRPDIKLEVAKKTVENRGGVLIKEKQGSGYTVKWPITKE